jgi:hypothetical protein
MAILGQGAAAWHSDLVDTLNFKNPPRRDTALLVGDPTQLITPKGTFLCLVTGLNTID